LPDRRSLGPRRPPRRREPQRGSVTYQLITNCYLSPELFIPYLATTPLHRQGQVEVERWCLRKGQNHDSLVGRCHNATVLSRRQRPTPETPAEARIEILGSRTQRSQFVVTDQSYKVL